MRLLPLSRARRTRAPHGLEGPKGWFPARVGVHVPLGGLHTRPQQVICSPSPSPHGTNSRTHGRRWPSPLSCRHPCLLRISPRVAAHGRFNLGGATSNHGLHLHMSSTGHGLSYSSCAGMHTHVPVVGGPNSPLGSSTMGHGAAHLRICG